MGSKLKLDKETILNNKFSVSPKGYDPYEVDEMLDKVIKDYETIEEGEILSKEDYCALKERIEALNKQVEQLSIELKQEKNKNKVIQNSKSAHLDNYELLLRIGQLEKIINEKLHLSIEQINSFDPDDC